MNNSILPNFIPNENMLFMFENENIDNVLELVKPTGNWKIKCTNVNVYDLYLEITNSKTKWVHEKYLRTIHDEDFILFLFEDRDISNKVTIQNQKQVIQKLKKRVIKLESLVQDMKDCENCSHAYDLSCGNDKKQINPDYCMNNKYKHWELGL